MLDATSMTQQRQAPQAGAWAATWSDLIDGNKRALMQWLQGTQAFSAEVSSAAQARMLLAMEAWSALLACRSPEQVAEHQRRFAAKAMEWCAEELRSFSQLAMRTTPSEPSR
jgi:Phasin protein